MRVRPAPYIIRVIEFSNRFEHGYWVYQQGTNFYTVNRFYRMDINPA